MKKNFDKLCNAYEELIKAQQIAENAKWMIINSGYILSREARDLLGDAINCLDTPIDDIGCIIRMELRNKKTPNVPAD